MNWKWESKTISILAFVFFFWVGLQLGFQNVFSHFWKYGFKYVFSAKKLSKYSLTFYFNNFLFGHLSQNPDNYVSQIKTKSFHKVLLFWYMMSQLHFNCLRAPSFMWCLLFTFYFIKLLVDKHKYISNTFQKFLKFLTTSLNRFINRVGSNINKLMTIIIHYEFNVRKGKNTKIFQKPFKADFYIREY